MRNETSETSKNANKKGDTSQNLRGTTRTNQEQQKPTRQQTITEKIQQYNKLHEQTTTTATTVPSPTETTTKQEQYLPKVKLKPATITRQQKPEETEQKPEQGTQRKQVTTTELMKIIQQRNKKTTTTTRKPRTTTKTTNNKKPDAANVENQIGNQPRIKSFLAKKKFELGGDYAANNNGEFSQHSASQANRETSGGIGQTKPTDAAKAGGIVRTTSLADDK